jgi:methylmalonyl-CoA mutase C-terminal domain/subunit
MSERKIRILLGKLGQGHKEAQLALARSFSEAGFEVIYTELQEPEAIIRSALQESVDHKSLWSPRARFPYGTCTDKRERIGAHGIA